MPYSIEKRGDEFEVLDASGKLVPGGKHPTRKQATDHLRALYANVEDAKKEAIMDDITDKATADINNLPDSAFLHVEAGGKKDDQGKTVPRSLRHLPYKTADGGIDLPKLRNALSRLGQSATGESGGDKWLTASLRDSLRAKAEGILKNNTDAESAKKETKRTIFEALIDIFSSATGKEGRRNSGSDADRLQQIHDLSVQNGAECPMVYKQADGKYRWIAMTTNSYQDRDLEIVSQKALEEDCDRMNASGDFGPYRLWHMGYPDVASKNAGPGIDIGTCDFSQMFGRIRVESGLIFDDRIAAAIKERADQWRHSVGFFHPIDQPDRDGVYEEIRTFERGPLPRGKASNSLTPLAAIMKENAMTTKDQKIKQLSDLLGDPALAETVLKQAEATEKAAQERGLAYKAKKGEEGSPEEEKTEPKKEAEEEGDEEDGKGKGKKKTAPDYEAMAKELAPYLDKMIEEKMKGAAKERTDKEASIVASVASIDAALKETRKIVDVLNADLPRGVKRYLASEADDTVAAEGKYKDLQKPPENPLGEIFNWLAQPTGVPPVQPSPEK